MDIKSLLKLLRNVKVKTFDKGEVLIKQGSIQKEVSYVRKGLVRSYYINEKLDDTTFQLYAKNDLLGNIHAIVFDEPSKYTYQALEKTKVYTTDFNHIAQKPVFDRAVLGKKLIKQSFTRVESLIFLTPEERYLKYLKDHPTIVNRAPDKYIAHVLGITPFSLSRIRKRLAIQKK